MAAVRKELVWSIKKQLFRLSSNDIYQVAKDIAIDSQHEGELNPNDEEGCMEYVVSYMQSDTLLGLEDEGMGQLMVLNDFICKVMNADAPVNFPVGALSDVTHVTPSHSPSTTIPNSASQPHSHPNNTIVQPQRHPNTHTNTTIQSVEELRQVYEELGEKLRRCESTAIPLTATYPHQVESESYYMPQVNSERPVVLKDLSYLQRRDFKIYGGQIGDQNFDLSYNNISKQIDEGLKEGFAEAEVVRGVLRVIKSGAFKDMLENKESITVSELKGFLRSHLGEKATTEMFQELMCARQSDQESPQQFLYRMIGLEQKLLFQSRQASTDISYNPKTIQEVFLHTIYQGLGTKHADLRQRLRPLTSNSQVTDEKILSQFVRIISDENEHQRRLGQTPRQKTAQAHSAKVETGDCHNNDKSQNTAADNKNLQTIQQLSAQVETLTHMVASLIDQQAASTQVSYPLTMPAHIQSPPPSQPPSSRSVQSQLRQPSVPVRGRTARCPKCTEQNLQECNHCFVCGETGHRAVGCLKRVKVQGNGARSLWRDTQRPVSSFSPE